MCDTGTPMPTSCRTTSATISYADTQCGWPPQFTLMPTMSDGSKNVRQAAAVVLAPVSARMLRASISRTTSSFAAPVDVSTHRSDRIDTTRPGYGPGIPGLADAEYFETTRSVGVSDLNWTSGTNDAAVSSRTNDLLCMRPPAALRFRSGSAHPTLTRASRCAMVAPSRFSVTEEP